ncbi:MAG: amino acid adenylation domain-containing protein, partial [Betaproteobacteria bacterium]
DTNPQTLATPDNLAYVIYTSGSTGKPKGVMVTHRNVARLLAATKPWFNFNEQDVWTCFHSCAFDFSVWEIWGALAYGGKLVMVPYLVTRDPHAFHALLRRERVTVLNQTPTAFQQLIAADACVDAVSELALRLVIFGGEALEFRSLRAWFDQHPDDAPCLVNMYGITETTVHVTHRPIRQFDVERACGSTIGRAIPDLRLHILDAHRNRVPIGVPGELYVGGAGLARGYLNREDLTRERFLPDPFAPEPGARMYRTGDLARYLPDGNIEYLGRSDDQLKIRGFRIEPGEIEACLCEHPAVRQAVVTAREDTPGDKRLIAYVVPAEGRDLEPEALRERLRERLPEYMRPGAYVALAQIPLTPNGKIDRNALPAPQPARDAPAALVAPRTPLEEAVAEVWCEILDLEQLSIHDNFFDLGGHSLLAARVIASLAKTFTIELPLREFFETPTVAAVAARAEQLLGTAQPNDTPPIQPLPRSGILPLSFAQKRLWFLDRLLPQKAAYNVPIAWRLEGPLDTASLQRALMSVLTRHEALRTRFTLHEGEPRQHIEPMHLFTLPLHDLSALPPTERETRLRASLDAASHEPFDLEAGPLLRAQLLRLDQDEHVLAINVHHIAFDGWSVGVLNRELSAAY